MNRLLLLTAAALLSFSAASHADEINAAAQPASSASSSADSDSNAPSAVAPAATVKDDAAPAPETAPEVKPEAKPEAKPKTEVKPAAKAEAKPATKAEAKAEAKPEAKAESKPEEKPAETAVAPAPVPEAKAAVKPLNSCAAKLESVADSYQQAHDGLLSWLRDASGKMDAEDAKIADVKKLIAEKEARITQLKLEGTPKTDASAPDLAQEARDLWTQLKTEEARRKDLCAALSTSAGQKVRDFNRAVLDQFEKADHSK